MARVDDPRLVIRMSPEEKSAIKAAADLNNIGMAGLVRECAIRYASTVAVELRASGKRLRRARVPERPVPPRASVVSDSVAWALERQRRPDEDAPRAE